MSFSEEVPAQTVDGLNENFGLPGFLVFERAGELVRAQVTLPSCEATVYLHGAHLTHWKPANQADVLFLSERSDMAPGKAIRGGIPVCFPWFGPDALGRDGGKAGPSHGFARLQEWTFAFAALAGDKLHLTLTLGPSEMSRSMGFDDFRAAYEMVFGGDTLTLRLTVANSGGKAMEFEEALHTYFAVGDVREAPITGLESAKFLDKTDGMKEKTGPAGPLTLTAWTDRVYPANTAATTIADERNKRTIRLDKLNSRTTVVWNPYPEATAKVNDLAPDAWPGFLCVETANTGTDGVTLTPGGVHTMELMVSVAPA